jgi:chemotaxis protein MotB
MALATRRSRRSSIDIWPGFVDALAQLLMVIIFILLVFTAGQFYLSEALSGRDQALQQLTQQINELSNLLALEKSNNEELKTRTASLASQLQSATTQLAQLQAQLQQQTARANQAADLQGQLTSEQAKTSALQKALDDRDARLNDLGTRGDTAEKALAAEKDTNKNALAEIETLTANIAALRDQLAKVAAALDVSEAKVKDREAQIVELGKRLNLALVNKVEELAQYRSEFFGRLKEILGDQPGIRVVGDRFVFQSEILFAPGSADLTDAAKTQLDGVITALKEIAAKIPSDLNWILRVDGHTDKRPISTAQFASNWELSTERAISVVRYAIAQGVPANHLAATGFADKQPLDPGDSDDAYRRNRRIELKLTEH